ncbi:serine/threonine-protein kinase [Rubricoccus marinus]|uniref:Protein kinase domain-containing protein n=1 Tax=Rubricoccus marinus TaxID=716817 RepID=A0A259U0F3_9BACT|nr:serine/threonine-protein kinase [Rubricoccus marinus]OZC03503.1 hypothetical protein BSZ36_11230 [Rubricoccus marinus]
MESPALPDVIDRYRVLGTLGRGGMGVVYRARDERLDREVALKMLPDEDRASEESRQRLLVEARAAARIDHPNVCAIYEVGETDDGRAFVAMGCYDGETLRDRLRRGPLAPEDVAELGRQIAGGLAAAHARGIVHRDLKPSNIFLCESDRLTAKILDFGIAKVEGTDLTKSGVTSGTLFYAAPEQMHGRAESRSDLWSLGVVLYEALTGRRPFEGSYEAATLYAILHEAPAPLPVGTPEPLASVVMRLLEKAPEERFASAREVEKVLTDSPVTPEARRRAARPRWVGGAVGTALALIILLGWSFWPASSANALPDEIHLAMLGFTPAASGDDEQAFAVGFEEALSSGITQLLVDSRDWVVPPREVRAQEVESASEARDELGANLALSGTVLQKGGRVYLTLNLLDTRTSRQIQSVLIQMAASAVGELQTRALQAISEMLGLEGEASTSAHLARGSSNPDALKHYMDGLGYLEQNADNDDLGRAVSLFESAIQQDPTFSLAYARLGEASLQQYEVTRDSSWIGRAETAGRRAVALDPGEPLAYVALSRFYRATGRYPRATQAASRAVDLYPTSFDALLALARAKQASADIKGAEEAFRKAIRVRSNLWTGYAELGYFLFGMGRYQEAIEQFGEVMRLVPANSQGYAAQGGVYHQLARQAAASGDEALSDEMYAKAGERYEEGLARRKTSGAYSNFASFLLEQGRVAEAIQAYRQALDINSADHRLWANLASALDEAPGKERERTGAIRKAASAAEASLRVNPQDAQVLASLAVYREELGQKDAARAAAIKAADLAPADLRTQYNLFSVFEKTGDRDRALEHLARAFEGGYSLSDIDDTADFSSLRSDPRFAKLRARSQDSR